MGKDNEHFMYLLDTIIEKAQNIGDLNSLIILKALKGSILLGQDQILATNVGRYVRDVLEPLSRLDLIKLEKKLDDSLAQETEESIKSFLKNITNKENNN